MTYKEACKLKIGSPVQARKEGNTNRLVTKIKKSNKDIFVTLDDGNKYHHTKLNPPILWSNKPFLCSWYGMVTHIDNAPLPTKIKEIREEKI